ncbi:MAG: recombinase family protein [Rhizobium sp.]|nr:recombinase family protein [Rhizobium sp.]
MKRAAVYARYSTDLQNDRSVEDQISLCKSHAERIGAEVVTEYFDRAMSGASMFGRQGLAQMIQAAERGEFQVLIAEAPDRISRDIADLAHVHKTLKFRGIEINCINGGEIDTVQVGMYGVIGQMQREEGAKKTKRGMLGVVRSGRNAGGKSYGYEPLPGQKGELRIVEAEAEIIRRVFQLYADGMSPRAIAGILNREGAPAPRGRQWNASTINGNEKRGHGILRNPLYNGQRIWNRVRMIKDPSTGRRVSRENDPSEYEVSDATHLRIVPEELFQAARDRKGSVGGVNRKPSLRSKRLLTGILRCASCGGALTTTSADRSGPRIMCSRYRESGDCENSGRYYVEKIERDVINRLRNMFADTSVIDAYVAEYQAESKRIAMERRSDRAKKEAALADVLGRIARIVDQLSRELIEEEDAASILPPLRAQRDALKADLAAEEPPTKIIEMKPKAVEKFRQEIEGLAELLKNKTDDVPLEFSKSFREVVSAILVEPRKAGEEYRYEIKGWLSALAGPDLSAVSANLMVAGGRVELPTLGL